MFGNLIESSSHKTDYARRGSFFLGTLTIYALIFLAIGVGSIYAYDVHIDNQNLELVALVTPVDAAEVIPQQRRETPSATAGSNNSKVAVVKTPPTMVTMNPERIAGKAQVSAPVTELPTGTLYRVGVPGPGDNIFGTGTRPGGNGSGTGPGTGKEIEELVKTTPPPAMEPKASRPPPARTKSMGVVNGMATELPRPAYSAIAKAAGARGVVTVQVLIDEDGKVISARALSGHPLLQRESVQAAYRARFTPTLLSRQPVKVSGVITYNFVMQ